MTSRYIKKESPDWRPATAEKWKAEVIYLDRDHKDSISLMNHCFSYFCISVNDSWQDRRYFAKISHNAYEREVRMLTDP